MANLFKKAAVCTDIHFGLKSNSQTHNDDCLNFIRWFIETAKAEGCETCFFTGDWHNNRAALNILTLNYSLRALEYMNDNFSAVYFIPGNHDLYYRDKRDVQSVEWARHLPNVHICNDWFASGDVVIAPWLVGDDHKKLLKKKGKYCFGHFELPGYYMNAMVQMPDVGEARREDFVGFEKVFTGHFHKRQSANNITYIGNCFPHNYADDGDEERGMMILEWGGEPVYHAWPDQPTYRVLSLSSVVNDADKIFKAKMHARVNIDIDLSYEEATFIKETFVDTYRLRELSLIPKKDVEVNADVTGEIKFESIDTIVQNQINAISSEHYDPRLLLDIYRNC